MNSQPSCTEHEVCKCSGPFTLYLCVEDVTLETLDFDCLEVLKNDFRARSWAGHIEVYSKSGRKLFRGQKRLTLRQTFRGDDECSLGSRCEECPSYCSDCLDVCDRPDCWDCEAE